MREDRSVLSARHMRFKREAQLPPPPLPTQRIAWAGGKIETNDRDRCLRKLLERKLEAGEKLTPEQERALQEVTRSALKPTGGNTLAAPPTKSVVVKKEVRAPSLTGAALLPLPHRPVACERPLSVETCAGCRWEASRACYTARHYRERAQQG